MNSRHEGFFNLELICCSMSGRSNELTFSRKYLFRFQFIQYEIQK